jgi:hypothetical protein
MIKMDRQALIQKLHDVKVVITTYKYWIPSAYVNAKPSYFVNKEDFPHGTIHLIKNGLGESSLIRYGFGNQYGNVVMKRGEKLKVTMGKFPNSEIYEIVNIERVK